MDKNKIVEQIEERISATENQLGGWADGISGLLVGSEEEEYECGCDRSFPNFENGNYICSLRKSGEWLADVVVNGGELAINMR